MPNLKSTTIKGNLTSEGAADFGEMPRNSTTGELLWMNSPQPNFQAWGTYHMSHFQEYNTALGDTNPLPTTAIVVSGSTFIPEEFRGNIAGLRCRIFTFVIGTSGAIWMTKPKGASGSGLDWTRFGVLIKDAASIQKDYIIPTDENGDFEMWGYTSTWQPRIYRVRVRGFWVRA